MASPDTIVLLIVDYHAVIWGQDPRAVAPCVRLRIQWLVMYDASAISPSRDSLATHVQRAEVVNDRTEVAQ